MAPILDTVASAAAFPYGAPAEATARFCPWCYRHGEATCAVQAHWPEVRPHNPLYLSGVECAASRDMEAAGLGIGLMLQPGSGLAGRADSYRWWAADNGCFSQGDAFDETAWFAWLASLPDGASPALPVRSRPRRPGRRGGHLAAQLALVPAHPGPRRPRRPGGPERS